MLGRVSGTLAWGVRPESPAGVEVIVDMHGFTGSRLVDGLRARAMAPDRARRSRV